jgi:hypothetical protein
MSEPSDPACACGHAAVLHSPLNWHGLAVCRVPGCECDYYRPFATEPNPSLAPDPPRRPLSGQASFLDEEATP